MSKKVQYISIFILILAIAVIIFVLPTSSTDRMTKFAVIGDYGEEGANAEAVAKLVKSWNPDLIITVGDNNYPDGEAATIDQNIGQYYHDFIYGYRGSYGFGSNSQRFFPSLGNHDYRTDNAAPYLEYFTLPGNERYYDFVKGDIHFFAIDSNDLTPDGNSPNSIQAEWLKNALAAADETWKIVYFHHPPFSSGKHGPEKNMQWDFGNWGVTAVISGHDHTYERLSVDNVLYFINGLGGGNVSKFKEISKSSLMRYNGGNGAMKVEANSKIIRFEFYNSDGVLIDSHSLHALTAPVNLTAQALSDHSIEIKWGDLSNAEDGFRIEKSSDGIYFIADGETPANKISYVSGNLSPGRQYFYRVSAFRQNEESPVSNIAYTKTHP